FEGPYQDPNGLDDCSSYDDQKNLICNECILNGNINGLNFGDGIVDNERWGMTGFLFWTAGGGATGSPGSAQEHYNYLRGYWKDNERMRYGGNGHPNWSTSDNEADFMMPRDSDPCGWGQGGIPMPVWTEDLSGHRPSDRWMVQSSGPFVLAPGAVNDITFGAVWARSYKGGMFASVDKMLLAEEKAQEVFDNCFRLIDGPDAPELTIFERDEKLIFHIWNKPNSNNYLEGYMEEDPFILCPDNDPDCDKYYKFQGYQVWQLRDHTVSAKEAVEGNPEKARLIFQCDIKDGVGQIVNHEWDHKLQTNVPKLEVEGADDGVRHSFVVEEDLFAIGSPKLVNFRDYYYVAVAYAYNNYQQYDQNKPESFGGQKQPYKAGRNSSGGEIRIYRTVPHKIDPEQMNRPIYGRYGDSPSVIQLEGYGSGNNVLDLDEDTHDEIMSGPPWKTDKVKYLSGKGPLDIKLIDPNNHKPDFYTLMFDSVSYFTGSLMSGKIVDANWFVYNTKGDTVFSESTISRNFDQLILEWGISVNVTQQKIPFEPGAHNNGFLEATMEFEDPAVLWLSFIPDMDLSSRSVSRAPKDWIRSGYAWGNYPGDPEEIYENVISGCWAPFKQAYSGENGISTENARSTIDYKWQRLASVDIYFTPNRDLWTRSPVIETTDDPGISIGNAEKFKPRESQSVDKWGEYAEPGSGNDTINSSAANYISETGMGWFPGYAIDVATGERLNIIYGESSWLTGDNGSDMLWNPSSREGSKIYEAKDGIDVDPLDVFFGGKHYIYIMGHNENKDASKDLSFFPAYDEGRYFMEKISSSRRPGIEELFRSAMWCAIPMLNPDFFEEGDIRDDPYGFVKNELKIRLRVAEEYRVDVWGRAVPDSISLNKNYPMYTFDTREISALRLDPDWAVKLMDMINIVPNPYYGNSGYSRPEYENSVKIINLPKQCTISIFTISGNLVRRIHKNESPTWTLWDLKNQNGIEVASGVYIVHIDIPSIGEKTLKWMGAMR
ncbi:MAG TPA: T9SS type A sorting domain-containing protein, partial [Bacteroidales bacterium]|nr:T9SS type A sorting domain-containing protein [Bacteroidales bacterium]